MQDAPNADQNPNQNPDQTTGPEPASLKFLRRLVTTLTITMIAGFVIIVALFVIRLAAPAPKLALPSRITLPAGARAQAFTQGKGWYAVVTDQNEILIYDRATGKLKQRVQITP